MSEAELPSAAPPPRPWFQFSLRTLFLLFVVLATSLGLFGAWGVAIFVMTVVFAIDLNKFLSARSFGCLTFAALCAMCVIGLSTAIRNLLDPGRNLSCMNHARQIVLALHAYDAANGHFPPAYVADKDGKPLYSWRVLILPYLEETALYKRFNLNEPWDSPNNKKLLAERPRDFVCPSDEKLNSPGNTLRQATSPSWDRAPLGWATSRGR